MSGEKTKTKQLYISSMGFVPIAFETVGNNCQLFSSANDDVFLSGGTAVATK